MKKGIYTITNIHNGKFYLGSSITIEKRWTEHKRKLNTKKHHSYKLQKAWCEEGSDSFKFEFKELFENISDKDLKNKEQWYLDTLQPWRDEIGYNIAKNIDYGKFNDERRRAINQYNLFGNFIKKWESIADIRHTLNLQVDACIKHKNRSCGGYVWCYADEEPVIHNEYGQKIYAKSICQYDKNGNFIKKWESNWEASRSLNISQTSICGCLKNRKKSAGGYQWCYEGQTPPIYFIKRTNKPLYQYSINNEFIKKWDSSLTAGRMLNISSSNICACARGVKNHSTAGGFIWKYEVNSL